jgi:hypothetical protein
MTHVTEKHKAGKSMSGIEEHTHDCMKIMDVGWFPIGRALNLELKGNDSEERKKQEAKAMSQMIAHFKKDVVSMSLAQCRKLKDEFLQRMSK